VYDKRKIAMCNKAQSKNKHTGCVGLITEMF